MISTLAGIVGAVAYGFISDKLFNARRPPVNLLFAICEIAGLLLIFFGPQTMPTLIIGMVLFGIGLDRPGDFARRSVRGGHLPKARRRCGDGTDRHLQLHRRRSSGEHQRHAHRARHDGRRRRAHYDFSTVILFWIGSSFVSMLLAASLWRVKLRD